jgi:8-oxo-dGTP pyrophosphatase MutT (NUDIX family)
MRGFGNIAIIHAKKEKYSKISGNGIEAGENRKVAATREALEEIGCRVKMLKRCLTTVEEWRTVFSSSHTTTLLKFSRIRGSPLSYRSTLRMASSIDRSTPLMQ